MEYNKKRDLIGIFEDLLNAEDIFIHFKEAVIDSGFGSDLTGFYSSTQPEYWISTATKMYCSDIINWNKIDSLWMEEIEFYNDESNMDYEQEFVDLLVDIGVFWFYFDAIGHNKDFSLEHTKKERWVVDSFAWSGYPIIRWEYVNKLWKEKIWKLENQ